jgi:hypothetical protein
MALGAPIGVVAPVERRVRVVAGREICTRNFELLVENRRR